MDDLRQAGRRLAAQYDALLYETPDDPGLRPAAVLGFGGIFGCGGPGGDVLDLGCGPGVQLTAAGEDMPGRLVGVDLSEGNCRLARERLSRFGARAEVHCADLLDLTPESLGRFDLVYAVGLVFAVPAPVRRHALALIGACLAPGGVALISHYGGAMAALRASLHQLLRAEIGAGLPPADAIARARETLARLMRQLDPAQPMREAARLTASLPDSTLFHEVFNPFCGPLPVRELDRSLSESDVRFLGHLEAPATGLGTDAGARALAADTQDLMGGGYHYALFGKAPRAPDLTASGIGWRTVLRRVAGEQYRIADSGETVQIAHAPTRKALEAIAAAPLPLLEAAPEGEREMTLRLFRDLWGHRLVTPLKL